MAQNAALKFAQREAETAIHAHNYVVVMNNEMRAPMRTITALSFTFPGHETHSEAKSGYHGEITKEW